VFNIVGQGVTDRALDGIHALVGQLGGYVAHVVHIIDVVATPAHQDVVGAIALEQVVERVACAIDGACACQDQVFDIVGQRVTD
jgi:hypothetical protein